MDKTTLFQKNFLNENGDTYQVYYSILTGFAEWGRFYGVEIEMKDAQDVVEKEMVAGLSENREEVEQFIYRLCEATVLPIELIALCDDFISEREELGKYKAA